MKMVIEKNKGRRTTCIKCSPYDYSMTGSLYLLKLPGSLPPRVIQIKTVEFQKFN